MRRALCGEHVYPRASGRVPRSSCSPRSGQAPAPRALIASSSPLLRVSRREPATKRLRLRVLRLQGCTRPVRAAVERCLRSLIISVRVRSGISECDKMSVRIFVCARFAGAFLDPLARRTCAALQAHHIVVSLSPQATNTEKNGMILTTVGLGHPRSRPPWLPYDTVS